MKAKKIQNKPMFFVGLIAFAVGLTILGYFGFHKISREIDKRRLLETSIVFEIPDLNIKAPVLEGINDETLKYAAGHFEGTGSPGSGNYCICGHSSTIYACIFNDLKDASVGMEMNLYDKNKNCYRYLVSHITVIDPDDTYVLEDYEDNRITVIACTDDGSQRVCVVGKLQE